MKVTLQDVARRAEVSMSTVSNALNGKRGVNGVTRERILSIASEMGYAALRQTNDDTHIKVVVFKRYGQIVMDNEFFTDMLNAITEECQVNQVGLMVTTVKLTDDLDLQSAIKELCQTSCIGMLVLATEMQPWHMQPFITTLPVMVALDSEFPMLPVHTVSTDNEQAGRLAALHLLEQGHRRVGYLDSSFLIYNAYGRRKGFLDTMAEAGFPVASEDIWAVTPTIGGAYRDMTHLLSQRGRPGFTACSAFNDITATSCVRAFKRFGLVIPDDISVIGTDDLQLCWIGSPNLTTVRVRRRFMARTAVRRLLDLNIKMGTDTNGILRTRIGVELVERDSVAKRVM